MSDLTLFEFAIKVQAMRKAQDLDAYRSQPGYIEGRVWPPLAELKADMKFHADIVKEVDDIIVTVLNGHPNEKNRLVLTSIQIAQALVSLNRAVGKIWPESEPFKDISDAIEILQAAYLTASGMEVING